MILEHQTDILKPLSTPQYSIHKNVYILLHVFLVFLVFFGFFMGTENIGLAYMEKFAFIAIL